MPASWEGGFPKLQGFMERIEMAATRTPQEQKEPELVETGVVPPDPLTTPASNETTRGRKPVPENETDSQKFVRLALSRVPAAAKAIELVTNLTARGYEWTPEQGEKIISLLDSRMDTLRAGLRKEAAPATDEFSL